MLDYRHNHRVFVTVSCIDLLINNPDFIMSHHVLVVDNDPLQCRSAELSIRQMPLYDVTTLTSGLDAIELLKSTKGTFIDLVLLDLSMPEIDGMEVLRAIKPLRPDLPVIIYTAHGDVKRSVEALKEGAADFVEKQDGPERLKVSIENVLRMHSLEEEVDRLKRVTSGQARFSDITGASEEIRQAKMVAERAAKSNITVLIKGESGVGKELFARAIHGESKRSGKPFIPVNCGAIPENLVESVLFGHEKGAFTGALEKTIGKFREADGGTLFLDEVGELSLDVQVKLLRAIQEGEVEPVGSGKPVSIDVRLISATHRDLEEAVAEGNFREDLYYRLNVFPMTVPSLRERVEDIEALAEYFIDHIAAEENRKISGISQEAKKLLRSYSWPGNVRQLRNAVYRAVVLCDSEILGTDDFTHIIAAVDSYANSHRQPVHVRQPGGDYVIEMMDDREFRPLSEIEQEAISSALKFYEWKISTVARHLGIGRSTLYRKIQEYGLEESGEAA